MRTLDLGEAVGPGVPTGGTANQVLVKNGATNFDTSWKDVSQLPAIGDEATAREAADAALADGLAIIANGDTHAAVAAEQAVYVRSHSTLAPGLYWANSAIGTNAALSTSNLTADSQGGLNKLKGDIDSLNSNVTPVQFDLTNVHSAVSDKSRLRSYKVGRFIVINGYFTINDSIASDTTLFTSSYKPLWLQVGHLDRSGYVGEYFPIYCNNASGAVVINCGTLPAGTYDINMIFVCQ